MRDLQSPFRPLGVLGAVFAALPVLTALPAHAQDGAFSVEGKTLDELRAQEEKLNENVWAKEVMATQYATRFTQLWDDLLASGHSLETLKGLEFTEIRIPTPAPSDDAGWGARIQELSGEQKTLSRAAFHKLLDGLASDGYALRQSEWHHSEFDVKDGVPQSLYHVVLHATQGEARHILDLELEVQWSKRQVNGTYVPARLTVRDAHHLWTEEPPAFDTPFPLMRSNQLSRIGGMGGEPQPIATYDYDFDGDLDIIAFGWNIVIRNEGGRELAPVRLLDKPPGNITAALIGDLTGDGIPDILVGAPKQPLSLYAGVTPGTFEQTPHKIDLPEGDLRLPYVLTTGDIDGDGDLDVWLGQYRKPYEFGSMPAPFYDANDGWPGYLLENDGKGNFKDITRPAGLAPKRKRRMYSASFVDIDDDGDMDLLTVNDFAGVDLFLNDGTGKFDDVTKERIPQNHLFGMGHAFADFDHDGRLDFYASGMGSTTARRIQKMGLFREDMPEHNQMRMPMGYGNRMFLNKGEVFEEPAYKDKVARTGWSWGTVAEDFDLDGFDDLYVGNGNASGKSTKDYCTQFWRHDVYVNTESKSVDLGRLFLERLRGVADGETSWNGYEHNALLMNKGGQGFLNLAFLEGAALEFDARAVGGDDHDGDGRVDLVLTSKGNTDDVVGIHLIRNSWRTENNWIGIALQEHPGGFSPFGAKVRVKVGDRTLVHQFVAGDSHQAQHSFSKVFGLGKSEAVDQVEVVWPGGKVTRLDKPPINVYSRVEVPALQAKKKPAASATPAVTQAPADTKKWMWLGAGLAAALLAFLGMRMRASRSDG